MIKAKISLSDEIKKKHNGEKREKLGKGRKRGFRRKNRKNKGNSRVREETYEKNRKF